MYSIEYFMTLTVESAKKSLILRDILKISFVCHMNVALDAKIAALTFTDEIFSSGSNFFCIITRKMFNLVEANITNG